MLLAWSEMLERAEPADELILALIAEFGKHPGASST